MESIIELIGTLDLTDAIAALMGLIAGGIAMLIKGTKTKLDDKAVKELADKLSEKLKDE